MKVLRYGVFCCAMLLLLGATAETIRVPQAEIDAENARWQAFGVTLPKGGVVLPEPYRPPYSNRSFVVPYAWYAQFAKDLAATHDVPVKADAVRADLPTLRLLMQKTYAGYARAAERGFTWDTWFHGWDQQLARLGTRSISLTTAFSPWERLQEAQYDGHSGIVGAQFTTTSSSAVLASRPGAVCSSLRMSDRRVRVLQANDAGQQPHAVQAWDGHRLSAARYISYPQIGHTAKSIRCGEEIALTTVPTAVNMGSTSTYQTLAGGIAYVRVPSFSEADDDALRNALSKASGLGKEQVVLLDLRGNGGGTAPLDLLTTWFSGAQVEEAAGAPKRVSTQSCFDTALQFNANSQALSSVQQPVPPALKQRIQQVVDSIGTTPPDACQVKPDVDAAEGDGAPHQFSVKRTAPDQTRLIVIVDEHCANECEVAARILSRLPDTVLVGASTAGTLGFAEPGYFVLPHSRVAFRLASSRMDFYGDGRSVEGYGFTVDVVLPTTASQQRDSLVALASALSH